MKKILISILVLFVLLAGFYFLFPGAVIKAGFYAARCKADLDRKELTVNDQEWVYLEGGKGETVLMLHGFGMHKDFWGELPATLTKKYRVVIPDLPGFGETPGYMDRVYDIPSQTSRIRAFVQKLGLDKFYLVGFSMGGGIAANYAAEYPDSVMGLVLIDAFGIDTPADSDFENLYAQGEKPLIYRNGEQFDRMMSLGYHTIPAIPSHIRKYIITHGAGYYDLHGKIFTDLATRGKDQLKTKIPKIKARTLILWGSDDRIFESGTAFAFGKGIRNSRVLIIPGAGHMVFMEKPDESIQPVTDFLESL